MKILFLILISATTSAFAQDPHCDFFKYCGGSGRSSGKSMPTSGSSAGFNPSSISSIKGFGVETLYQPNNPLGFNFVTGTGKIGGAVISPTLENSFFGNRSVEIDEVYLKRSKEKKRYRNKKINLAIGANLVSKKDYSFDLGISAKRNPDVKKINPGVGATLRLWNVSLAGYLYRDDTKIDLGSYVNPYTYEYYYKEKNSDTYTEKFTVATFSIGTKIKDLSLDIGIIKTKYDFYPTDTTIRIYSLAYNYKNYLFNFALRNEHSANAEVIEDQLMIEQKKNDIYFGVQYIVNKHVLVGLGYNTFLLNELSMTLTLFL